MMPSTAYMYSASDDFDVPVGDRTDVKAAPHRTAACQTIGGWLVGETGKWTAIIVVHIRSVECGFVWPFNFMLIGQNVYLTPDE